ncbi:S8 family serine peptidase [Oceanobacillus bengalensis]|uniref:LPXTG cell wall anchor domain-containing protein n=1 Tax=Oceanobacillus bengalensis TaxID=1435466 RepID=A0A494YX23_9BACI|nr:S8 family serine peptidase [Oceanobacillus bengalensis]RKQ14769.1 LPXTG cell wall anchor domain-containing protein [Oceanobacillus bengalensis]
MKGKLSNKFSSILLIITLIFSLFNPVLISANSSNDSSKQLNTEERIAHLKETVSKQRTMLEQKPAINPSLQEISGNKEVAVIVQLSEPPVALEEGQNKVQGKSFSASQATTAKTKVINEQARFEKALKSKKINYEKGFTYHQAFNGMSIKLKASELDELLTIDGVLNVEPDEVVHALDISPDDRVDSAMVDSVPHLEVPELWEDGYEGEGVKVAVLDTGIDYNHPDFEGIYKGGYNFIKHGPDYARERADDDPYETTPEDWPEHMPEFSANGSSFYTSHGTHVAGIIAATGNNDHGIKGIAPKIDLYAYRVLGAYGSGMTSGIIAGIDKAVEEDMDIINLSLGGGSNSQTAPDSIAINNATLAGVTSIVATGNSGPGRGTVGNPASAALAISVGNSTLPEETIQATLSVEAGTYSDEYNVALMGWTFAEDPAETLSGSYDVVAVPGFGAASDYEGIDAEGKVVLASRGEIAFVDKIAAAKDAGAVGIIIHNNVEGDGPADVLLGNSFGFIPTYDIATADGQAFREAIEATENKTGKVTFSDYEKDTTEGDHINDSSSRGPSTPVFDIKPDVSAPGTNIMSTIPAYGKDDPEADYAKAYDRKTGTSMAAPQVAGIAALLLSKNPDWTPYDVKVALSNTAKQLDTELYDVFAQGPGRVQPLEAVSAEALAYALDTTESDGEIVNYEKGTVTFGRVSPDPEQETTKTKEIEVRNLSGASSNYDVSVEVTKAATGELADASVSVDKSSFTLGDSETLNVELTVPAGEESPGNELLGYIHITNGTTNLSLPFAVEFSTQSPTGLEYFELEEYAISPNGDGKHEEALLQFGLLNDEEAMSIELWDAVNPDGGAFGDGYLGYFAFQPLQAGYWSIPIGGTYVDWGTDEETVIPDGVYTIDFNSWDLESGDITFLADDGPFFVKTTASEIEFDTVEEEIESSEYEVTGTITDGFIDFKETVENMFALPYDVNEKLTVTYEVTDKDGNTSEQNEVVLEQDGTFAIPLTELPSGENTLSLHVNDIVENTATADVTLNVKAEAPKEMNVTLTPSTTEPTEGPVTITVDTDSETELVALKWLEGEKTAADFAEAGNDIALEAGAFDVTENGTYTVYVKNSDEVEAVQTIEVANITEPVEEVNITLTPSTTEPTEGPVTITVDTDSESELVALKWLEGEKTAEDFAEAGNDIALEAGAFDVSENGTYTVYVKNSDEVEAIQTIAVENITEPVEEVNITLTASTTEPTEGPVTINVDTDSESELVTLKWLEGKKTAEDFAEAGNDIELEVGAFDVTENGTYSVYVKNSEELEAVQTITVTNITNSDDTDPEVEFNVTLTPSTTEPTEGPVTISIDTDSASELVALKWLEGKKTAEDFAEAGNDIALEDLAFDVTENGTYSVYMKNTDDVEVVQTIAIENITEPVEEVNITLAPSTTEHTEGPVTISVDTDSVSELVALKWLEGEKTTADFAEAGNDIELETGSFDVTENGTYTVYVKNSDEVEAVQTIEVENITDPVEEINVTLTPSTTDPTEGPVTISVNTDSESDLVALKWLKDEKSIGDFAEAGNEINLEAKAFDVTANGMYTVYVKNSDGVEAVQTIKVTNIEVPDVTNPAEEINVTLTPSTTEPTEGPITITVDTNSETDLVALKWLKGDKAAEDFVDAGNDIDLEVGAFDITENGTYTVYVKNSDGVEAVQTIEVTNITEPPNKPSTGTDTDGQNKNNGVIKDNNNQGNNNGSSTNNQQGGKTLPDTATNTFNYIAIGAILLMVGILAVFIQYRRKNI